VTRGAALALTSILAATPPAGGADFLWIVAFGDSITEGCCDDMPRDGGYPERLAAAGLMDCTYFTAPWPPGDPNAQECPAAEPFPECAVVRSGDCVIANRGLSGERAAAGALTRLQNEVLPEWPWDALVFMEGTNDIFHGISVPSIMAAIRVMEEVTVEAGVDFVAATIIEFHPLAVSTRPWMNVDAATLNAEIAAMAAARNRFFSDQSERICPDSGLDFHGHTRSQCQNFDYGEKATVGHPSRIGYDNMADGFLGTLTELAIPGVTTPTAPSGPICGSPAAFSWAKESGESANWYRVSIDGGSAYDAWHQEIDWRAGEPDLCQPDANPNNTCSLTSDLPALGAGTHSWRVRGRNPAGLGPWSSTASFELFSGAPTATVATSPDDATFDSTPTYRWTDLSTASEYDLEVFNGATWVAAGTYSSGACNGATCSASPASPVLTPGARSFRVRTRNPCASGPLSAEQAFDLLDCAAYPNLQLQNTTVTGAVTRRACATITAGNLGAGDYVVDGPAANLVFHAGSTIALGNGFSVRQGSFTAGVDY
jgi:lysophospholipase L1-like esterase